MQRPDEQASPSFTVVWELVCLLPSGRAVVIDPRTGKSLLMNKAAVAYLKQIDLADGPSEAASRMLEYGPNTSGVPLQENVADLIETLRALGVLRGGMPRD